MVLSILSKLTFPSVVILVCLCNVITFKNFFFRFVLGFLSLLVKLGIFRKVKLGFLRVGHTHEDVDRVFSRYVIC